MAGLEDKLLGGETVGYCSSSEDEDDSLKFVKDDDAREARVTGAMRNTGPKGVLEDWRSFKEEQRRVEELNAQKVIAEAKRGMLSGKSEDGADDLEQIRLQRMQQLKDAVHAKGKVVELATKEQFLAAIDKCRGSLLLIHIYETSVEACTTMNTILCSIAARHPEVKLARVKSSVLHTSANFSKNGLPTLQVYYNDLLVGNFVRITDQLGEDFTVDQLQRFLYDHDIDLSLNEKRWQKHKSDSDDEHDESDE